MKIDPGGRRSRRMCHTAGHGIQEIINLTGQGQLVTMEKATFILLGTSLKPGLSCRLPSLIPRGGGGPKAMPGVRETMGTKCQQPAAQSGMMKVRVVHWPQLGDIQEPPGPCSAQPRAAVPSTAHECVHHHQNLAGSLWKPSPDSQSPGPCIAARMASRYSAVLFLSWP